MAAANRITGADLVVLFVDGSGTVDLTGDQRNFTPNREQATADVTAGGDSWRVSKATIKNFSATLEVLMTGTAGTATMSRIDVGDEGTLLWGELGTATGKPKWGYPVIVSNASQSIPFDDAAVWTVEFQGQGDEVFNGNTSTW